MLNNIENLSNENKAMPLPFKLAFYRRNLLMKGLDKKDSEMK
jgi:hypothetical protein